MSKNLHHGDISTGDSVVINEVDGERTFKGEIDDFKISSFSTSMISEIDVRTDDGKLLRLKLFKADNPRMAELAIFGADSKLKEREITVNFEL